MMYLALVESGEDKRKFEALYWKLGDKMYRVALRLLRDEHRAQDAVQESFIKIAKNFKKISALKEVEVAPYVVTIVENTAKDMLRYEGRRPTEPLDETWEPPAPEDAQSVPSYERLVELILEMSEQFRDPLYMFCVEEESRETVAKRLRLTVKQVDNYLYRGRKILQARVLEEGYTP